MNTNEAPPKIIAGYRFDNLMKKDFSYRTSREFKEKLIKIADEAICSQPSRIMITFMDRNKKIVNLKFYNVTELLLFINGMKILGMVV